MKPRNSNIFLLTLALIIASCKTENNEETKIVEGDLYFNFFRFVTFYNEPDSITKKIIVFADTANRKLLDSSEQEFLAMYDVLKKEKLLYSPYVEIIEGNNSIIKLVLSQEDYRKFSAISYEDLVHKKRRIHVKSYVRQLTSSLVYCKKLLLFEEMNGETRQQSRKLKVTDYP